MKKGDIRFYINNGYFEFPKELQIEITNRCTLSCPQCYKSNMQQRDMDVVVFVKVMEEAQKLGVKTIVLNGGEPFQHEKITSVLKVLKAYDFQILCISSGIGLDDTIIKILKELDLDFQLSISLNGSTKEINELSRDGYEVSLRAMDRLRRAGIDFGINWVCRHDNVRDFPNLVSSATLHGAKWINIAANKLTGKGEAISALDMNDYIFISDFLKNQEIVEKKFIRVQYCFVLLNDLRGFGTNKHLSSCPAGTLSLCVDVNGKFSPCTHLYYPETFGSMLEYWNDSKVIKTLRMLKKDKKKCKECLKPMPCHYCRMMFENTGKNILEEPDDCPLKKYYKEERIQKDAI